MFDPGIHHKDMCVPGPLKLNSEHLPIFNSGKKLPNYYSLKLFLMIFFAERYMTR